MQAVLILKKAVSWLLILVSTVGAWFSGHIVEPLEGLNISKNVHYALHQGISFGQGITTDGEYFYGFGALKIFGYNAITKMDAKTGKIVDIHEMCIPADLMKKKYNHLGDGGTADGKLYVACEDAGFRNPAVLIYDAGTLEYLDMVLIPEEHKGNGHLPWCTVQDGILYYSQYDDVQEIHMLDLTDDYRYIGSVLLDKTLFAVQGGDIYEGVLYLATNDGLRKKPTFAVDLTTGETTLFCNRDMGNRFTEAEGLTIFLFEDGSLFHYIDVATSVFIRNYHLLESE